MTTSPDSTSPDEPGVESPPAPPLELRGGLPLVVESADALDDVVDALAAGTGPFAVDAERASGYRYSQRAYLIQMRRAGSGSALVDPIPFGDVPNESLKTLGDAVAETEWVIHAASQDLPCLAEVGMRPHRLFDTELAGRLLNYPRVGLAVMVEELLGFSMRKEHSAVDWSKRPLPEPWLRYAALDVEVLLELRDVLADQLADAGKTEWARQEFAAWAAMPAPVPRREPWRRTSGIHRVRGRRGLGLVRAMWELRDEIARGRDITSGRVVPDSAIVEAAQAAPASRGALAQLKGFSSRGGQRYVKDFHRVIASTLRLPEAELPTVTPQQDGPPPPRAWPDKNPAAAARLRRCRDAVTALADDNDVPQENLLAPDAVRRLAWAPPEPATPDSVTQALEGYAARPWQVQITATALADALAAAPSDE